MKAGAALLGMARLLHATHGPGTAAGVESRREAYLRYLDSCPERELRKRLDFKFRNGGILEAREIMQREGVYSRTEYGGLDGYFAMVGMTLTDGMWHNRYVGIFEKSSLDMEQDEEMVRRLMDEMATGSIWKDVNRRLAEAVAKRLEGECNDGRRARDEDVRPSSVVDHAAWAIEKRLPQAHRKWGRVLETLLRRDGVRTGIVEGRYNEELRGVMRADKELERLFYCWMLGRKSVLDDMMDMNKALVKEIVAGVIEQGYWLHMDVDVLEKAMMTESVRRLFLNVFEKMRAEHGMEERELSIRRLRELAQEGRLDKLVKRVIRRLIRHGQTDDLGKLMETVGRKVFDELLSRAELDAELKESVRRLIRCGRIGDLKEVIETVRGRFDELVLKGELDVLLGEGMRRLLRDGWADDLHELTEIEAVKRRVFNGLLRSGKLDAAIGEGIEVLVGHGGVVLLKKLVETVGRKVFDKLLGSRELDVALKKGMDELVKYGKTDELKWLIENVKGRVFDRLVGAGELDALLNKMLEGLVRSLETHYDYLKWLLRIEIVMQRVSDGLLDLALKRGIEWLITYEERHELEMLMEIDVVKKRYDELVSRKELGGLPKRRIKYFCSIV